MLLVRSKFDEYASCMLAPFYDMQPSRCSGSLLELSCVFWDGLICTIYFFMRRGVFCFTLTRFSRGTSWLVFMFVFGTHVVHDICDWSAHGGEFVHCMKYGVYESLNGAVRRFNEVYIGLYDFYMNRVKLELQIADSFNLSVFFG
jgi:hypothetical protein